MEATDVLKDLLAKDERELLSVSGRIEELAERKALLEKNVESLRWLVSAKVPGDIAAKHSVSKPATHRSTQASLFSSKKSAREVFQDIIAVKFSGKTFKEADIRNAATEDGYLVNGKAMSKPYARGVFGLLQEAGVIERTEEQGTYRTKAQVLSDRLDKAMGTKK